MILGMRNGAAGGGGAPTTHILQESGFAILLEDGSFLLLE
jgi:hypothetical protein